MAKVFNAPSDI